MVAFGVDQVVHQLYVHQHPLKIDPLFRKGIHLGLDAESGFAFLRVFEYGLEFCRVSAAGALGICQP